LQTIRYWLPVFFVLSVIFYLSSLPPTEIPQIDFPYIDKIVHLLIYCALGFAISRALTASVRNYVSWEEYRSRIFASILLATLYGVSDELHQSYVPGRSVEFLDLVADAIGSILGGFLCVYYRNIVIRLEKNHRRLR